LLEKIFLLSLCAAGILLLSGCDSTGTSDTNNLPVSEAGSSVEQDGEIMMNQVQYLGSHNSFHKQTDAGLSALLVASGQGELVATLEYGHVPLAEQFESHGVRHIELDIFHDPDGGRYANHDAQSLVPGGVVASGVAELDEPGLKVLHVQDIDYETTCYTFTSCLRDVKGWSDSNPTHLPITILIQPQSSDNDIPAQFSAVGLTAAAVLPFDSVAVELIETEVRSVFTNEQLILPDDVRGDFDTLEMAALNQGWPLLSEVRGRIMFVLTATGSVRDDYIAGHPSLEGRAMFTTSEPGTPEAAALLKNDPEATAGEIRRLVEAGYIVRTRADADLIEARADDTTRREAAFDSGAQLINTDFFAPNTNSDFNGYQVVISGGTTARCNPVSAPVSCDSDLL
jgi:hypothetical protein